MKKQIFLFLICACVAVVSVASLVSQAEAKTVTVSGRIIMRNGRPAANCSVVIRLEDVRTYFLPPNTSVYPDLPLANVRVTTNASGNYTAQISFPDLEGLAIRVEALKYSAYPFEEGLSFVNAPLVDGARYTVNIRLNSYYPKTVVIKGYVTDEETGQPINNLIVGVSAYPLYLGPFVACTDSNGYYEVLVGVGNAPFNVSVYAPREQVSYCAVLQNDVKYINKVYPIIVSQGNVYQVNLALKRDPQAGYIYGTVINATTGAPIPYALVGIYSAGYQPNLRGMAVTDFLGRYKHFVNYTGAYEIDTSGGHSNVAHYFPQSKNVTAVMGESKQLNFEMVPK